ncbi:MAG: class I SAM-dependent methyltransferase [Deltaproteobacteria bacterium]|nr:class I SAM-dependent methyltransferase [Deltaproteobacteria bacterium]
MPAENDYHKYFIVDGKHVGDYESMYRFCPDPWRIEELGLRLDMKAALLLVDSLPLAPLRVLDAGAGAGLLSLELIRLLGKTRPGSDVILSDISETALGLAKKRIEKALGPKPLGNGGPEDLGVKVTAAPFDLRQIGKANCPWPDGTFDLVFLAQTLWGLVENLEGLFPGLRFKLKTPGHLIISQHFPGPDHQSYAAFVDPALVSKLAKDAGFKLLHTLETDRMVNHHWAALWSCD